jgi:uncharacterized protein
LAALGEAGAPASSHHPRGDGASSGPSRSLYSARLDAIELLRGNLLSPIVLAFALGLVATWVKSDLKLPEPLYQALSIYLLLAIGIKGGVELSRTPLNELALPAIGAVALGAATPLWCIAILRTLGKLDLANSAAIAAHYGSVSAVTFLAATSFLDAVGVPYEGFVSALVAVLEVPAIVVALLVARRAREEAGPGAASWGAALHEVLAGRSIVLLVGGLAIGALSGKQGIEPVAPLFQGLFRGALVLFLLEMGMVAARRLGDLKKVGAFLVAFAVVMPVVHAVLGLLVGRATGLSQGGATVLAVLSASASYIAAPAAVRIALPQANPTWYLTASLGVTFPFNLAIGIPLYHEFAQRLYAG